MPSKEEERRNNLRKALQELNRKPSKEQSKELPPRLKKLLDPLIKEQKEIRQQRQKIQQQRQLQQLDKDISQYLSDTRGYGYRNKILSRFFKKDLATDLTKLSKFKTRLIEFFKLGEKLNLTSDQYDRMLSLNNKLKARKEQMENHGDIVNGVKPKKIPKKRQLQQRQSSTDSFTPLFEPSKNIKTADLNTSGPKQKRPKKKQRTKGPKF